MTDRGAPRRYLLCTWEGGGSVGPMVTLARKLLAAGHAVRIMSDECNRLEIEAVGARFVPWTRAPSRPDRRRESEYICDWATNDPLEGLMEVIEKVFAGPSRAYARDVIEELSCDPADLVVTNDFLLGVLAGCEAVRQPVVALSANSVLFPIDDAPRAGPGADRALSPAEAAEAKAMTGKFLAAIDRTLPSLNGCRASLGLAPLSSLLDQLKVAKRTFIAVSRHFDMAVDPISPAYQYVGPLVDDPEWTEPWRSPWPDDDTRPLVLVGFSTTFQNHAAVLQRVIDALAAFPVRVLVTLGPAIEEGELNPAPNTAIVSSAPHNVVMREAALVVTHGGHGTVARAMLHDLPMLVIPHGRDQDGNAARIAAHGAGITLPPGADRTALARALERLLNDRDFRVRAAALGSEVRRETEQSPVVAALEELACPAYA